MIIKSIKPKKLTLNEINTSITPKLRLEATEHFKKLGLKDDVITEILIVDYMRTKLKLYIK